MLIALVVTLVVLLILAGISINLILGADGIINTANQADKEYQKGTVREKLSIVLVDAAIEKQVNPKYNENDFLDNFLYEREPNVEIEGEEISLDGFTFELDRSVPQIGEYIGETGNLPPRIQKIKVLDRQLNAISIEIMTARAENAKYIYSYKEQSEQEYQSTQQIEDKTYQFTDLEFGKKYDIKVELIMNNTVIDTEIVQISTLQEVFRWEKWSINKQTTYEEVLKSQNVKKKLQMLRNKSVCTGYKIENNEYVLTKYTELGDYQDHGGATEWGDWVVRVLRNYVSGGGNKIFKATSAEKTPYSNGRTKDF